MPSAKDPGLGSGSFWKSSRSSQEESVDHGLPLGPQARLKDEFGSYLSCRNRFCPFFSSAVTRAFTLALMSGSVINVHSSLPLGSSRNRPGGFAERMDAAIDLVMSSIDAPSLEAISSRTRSRNRLLPGWLFLPAHLSTSVSAGTIFSDGKSE